nr:hypothetical protein [Lentibacillus sp. CBA3610]
MAPMTNWSSNSDGTVSDDEVKYYNVVKKASAMVVNSLCQM